MVSILNNHFIINARAPQKANEVFFPEVQFLCKGYSLRRYLQSFVNKKCIPSLKFRKYQGIYILVKLESVVEPV